MPAHKDLATRIAHAHRQLKAARESGCAVQILFWRGEVDHLLDEWTARAGAD
ncbi:MAG: hypothetical protein K0U84_24895 [Actinomycetia bacterium]|nr:hypothetical protein [Actinomycetes bacterium]